uniref:Retrovirus-related Pol polyprotein from transposon TNT 1-94 n=1 Tax=Tanacetum cinerariifolium TaxID=118510 RepID=A0A6L2LQ38_TANCI|nr:hypothetical protein [Tanacetum cinerariifolium]
MQTQTSNTLHNAIMEASSKDRPPMLAPGNYVQWKSRIKRYIDTKPNHELIHYCLTNPLYNLGWIDKEVPISEGSPITRTEKFQETYKNVSQDIRDQLNAEAEAVQIILKGIDNYIYSTVDACPNDDGESLESYYSRFYKMMNELIRKQCNVTNHQVNVQFLLQLQPEWQRSQQATTRNRGKAIVNSPQPIYDQEPSMVAEDDETSKDKEIDKLMALISLSFKKIYKPTNNNLRTSSNTSRANQDNSPRINRSAGYENQRIGNVVGARETVGSTAMQKSRIQCYNCKEFGYVARECQKPKRVKDAAYHREKMLLYDADSGPIFDDKPLQKVSNDDHYNVFTLESEHPEQSESVHDTYPIDQDAHNVIIDSLDMSYDKEEIGQNDDDNDHANERELLASLIEKLKYEIDENKNRNKFLETSNKVLIEKLKEMKDKLSAHQETISILSQQKEAQIKLYKTREDKELDKVIALENKVKVLDNIVYKTGKSVQTMNMLNNKCRTSFVKHEFLKKGQRVNPHLLSQISTGNSENTILKDINRLSREYYYVDHMNAILGVYTKLDEVTNLQCDYLELLEKYECLETELSKKNLSKEFRKEREQYFEIQDLKAQLQDKGIVISELKKLIEKLKGKSVDTKFEKSSVIRQPNAFKSQSPSILGKPTTFLNSFERKDFSKSKSVTQNNVSNDFSKPVTAQTLPPNKKSILKNMNVLAPGMYKVHTKPNQARTSQLPQDYRKTNKRVSFFTGVIPTTSVSRPQLKSNLMGDRVMRNNSQGKKQEVEDPRRSVKFSKNKTSVTACNDILNAKTLNVNFVCAICDKCVLNEKHDMCVLNSVEKSLKKTVDSESNQKPRNITRKLYERVSKICSWWYPKFTPSGYKWKPKSGKENVNPNTSIPLGSLVEIVLFIVDFGCSKHMTRNLKLLINFIKKFLGTVKFRNGQIAPILGYGDLVQGAVTIKRVYYVEGLNRNLFSVGQFCDADLEVAFRKSTCYIHDLKRNDLLTGSHGTDLYSITLQDTNYPNPICLMVKASSSQAWLVQQGLQAQVRIVQTDKGTKFLNQTLHVYFAAEGILHQTSIARTPEQNGVVKRRNHTLVEATRTILSAAKVPLFFWAEAIATTCFTQNRSLVIPRHEKTPYHIINDRKPLVKFFYIFGSLCYIVRDDENLDKIKEKCDECIFVGYSTQSRAYRVFNKRTRVIMESIHVNFDELPHMASDHVSSDPAPECQKIALEHDSLSLAIQRQANVPQADRTVTTSNELDLLFSLMFDELLNGSSKVWSKSFVVSSADAPNQRQQHTTPLNNHTTPAPTCQVPTLAPSVSSFENINQAETYAENDQVADDEFINIFCSPVQDQRETSSRHVDLTRRQLESDGEMCMFALTVSRTEPKNIKEAMADSAWIESIQEELHQFDVEIF